MQNIFSVNKLMLQYLKTRHSKHYTLYNHYLWLSLRKLSLMAHLVLQEIPILSIETAVLLLCLPIVMLDLQYN